MRSRSFEFVRRTWPSLAWLTRSLIATRAILDLHAQSETQEQIAVEIGCHRAAKCQIKSAARLATSSARSATTVATAVFSSPSGTGLGRCI